MASPYSSPMGPWQPCQSPLQPLPIQGWVRLGHQNAMKPKRTPIKANYCGLEKRGKYLADESGKLDFKILSASSFPGRQSAPERRLKNLLKEFSGELLWCGQGLNLCVWVAGLIGLSVMQAWGQERVLKDFGGKEVACERGGMENNLTAGVILVVNSGQPKAT